ncbi:hypothetical protein KIN20_031282 [Parelaphostrongylus tenuis]|uniref:Uncharacterized protein n=1 Tax=Parelaphostrongylus tenuis TaxID=148309 RepID=A0AAD5R585_PARTN|nr:hypothetical protein KIN20_031282 [Parelaphostrongylus tenuis]
MPTSHGMQCFEQSFDLQRICFTYRSCPMGRARMSGTNDVNGTGFTHTTWPPKAE